MGIAELPACDSAALKSRLYDEYHIEVPIIRWHERPFVRVSVQGYNSPQDLDALVSALEALLPSCGGG